MIREKKTRHALRITHQLMTPKSQLNFFQIDAFTDQAFRGNPAAIVILTKAADAAWMQTVAMEMNLSETAFAWPHEDPFTRAWRLRWFTPATEVALCGHATLATAFVLWSEGYLRPDQSAQFETKSGRLSAEYAPNGNITLNFPRQTATEAAAPDGLLNALGIDAAVVSKNDTDYLVEVDSAETVRNLAPDFAALAQVKARGVMVTAPADSSEHDFVSRFFAPASGIPEDPVTGSAHCCLAPYWAEKLGKTTLIGYQASPRSGTVHVELDSDRVKLSGKAVAIVKGQLLV